ncbi:MAG: hypothetical protein Q4D78_07200 [Neisseria zoodegmatis]|nr:hypothetical protein [Neisseria zoodegmatis]MDO5069969.1 hypothetical protein [Neisseria zoodegmatis]
MAMDKINPSVNITAAVRFDTEATVAVKTLKQQLQAQTGIDARRLSRLSLIAALGGCLLRERAAIKPDCAVYAATPFFSPSLFEKMADNVLNHHVAMPFDFIANLHNAPAFHTAQALGTGGASLVIAADNRPESWHQIVQLAANRLNVGQQTAVGWCYEQPPQSEQLQEGSIWILLERGGQNGAELTLGISDGISRPSENCYYWQGVADWLNRLNVL